MKDQLDLPSLSKVVSVTLTPEQLRTVESALLYQISRIDALIARLLIDEDCSESARAKESYHKDRMSLEGSRKAIQELINRIGTIKNEKY